tara:strand:- start:1638 stop:2684 length:1047 start_codon:yes stop_codon:yes gene_type:complete
MRGYLLGLLAGLLAGSVSAQDIQTIERPMIIVELRGEAPGWTPEIVIGLDGIELLRTTVSPQWQEVAVRLPDGYESAGAVSIEHVLAPCSINRSDCDSAQAELFLREITFAGESLRLPNATIARSGDLIYPGDTQYYLTLSMLSGVHVASVARPVDVIAPVDDHLRGPERPRTEENSKPEACAGGDASCDADGAVEFDLSHGPDSECVSDAVMDELNERELRRQNELLAARISILEEVTAAHWSYESLKSDLWDQDPDNSYPGMEEAPRFLNLMPDDIETAFLSELRAGLAHLRGLASLPAAPYGDAVIEPADINEAIGWHMRLIAALERLERAEERMNDLRAAMSCD